MLCQLSAGACVGVRSSAYVDGVTGWTTTQAAEKCGLSQHTLRWQECIGLLDRILAAESDGRN